MHYTLSSLIRLVLLWSVVAHVTSSPLPAATSPQTERHYLSGKGPGDAVPWDFSVTAGRRAGEWSTIPVPSNWEMHGFGGYDYGQVTKQSNEQGLYRLRFSVPESWRGRRIRLVFEGVMTDATVKVNGTLAGPTHVGGFYRFQFDVTSLLKLGPDEHNLLEVEVSKASSNPHTEAGERFADYWVFGGIFRPVWLEASPVQAIERVAINARADGSFTADITLASVRGEGARVDAQIVATDGTPLGGPFSARIPAGGAGLVHLATKVDSPRLWTAETPHLYSLQLTLRRGEETLHTKTERFGFRTFELRPGQGIFLNGQRILLKGVNRHSFRPETGRALDREDCYADARLIKEMNMNAVRMSHYPPDEAFLEACDELGLYVLNELSGWHHAHDTAVGRRLIRAMIERDVNHPSILFWDNGNEGGWNRELDGEFALHDPQKRRVLHPWELHDDMDTKHYPTYDDLSQRLRGPNLVMPTEFVHALYDGGGAAALDDYWTAIAKSPFGAGGFIWVFADEGVVRTDQNNRIDVYGTYAPDGLVGPHHEKEGSFHAVRDLWSPVQIDDPALDARFTGKLSVHNRYEFTSLAQCRFSWQLVRFPGPADKKDAPATLAAGDAPAPLIPAQTSGVLEIPLPANWRDQNADALTLTAFGPDQQPLWTWTWATPHLAKRFAAEPALAGKTKPAVEKKDGQIRLTAGDVVASFDGSTGLLQTLRRGEKLAALTNGPRLVFARPKSTEPIDWLPFTAETADTPVRQLKRAQFANTIEVDLAFEKSIPYAGFQLEISPDGKIWKTIFNADRRSGDGKSFEFPPQIVAAIRLSNVRRSDGQPIAVKSVRIGYAAARFASSASSAVVTTGSGRDANTGESTAWLETSDSQGLSSTRWSLHSNGTLQLDYAYKLEGAFLYHGVTFDHPEEKVHSLRWLGEGPYRVWQNRLRGTWLGVHQISRHTAQPGADWTYPEFHGFFAGVRWTSLATDAGTLTVTAASPETYLRVGTPQVNHHNTTVEFPAGDLSFMQAIPAIGSKFVTPEKSGPSSQPAQATGLYRGSLRFHVD